MAARSVSNFSTVFHSISQLQQTLALLQKDTKFDINSLNELKDIATKHSVPVIEGEKLHVGTVRNPVIVIEGLDASGKSTLIKELASDIGCSQLQTPPSCLSHLRPKFDGYSNLARRAFYCIGNYIAAQQIAEESQSRTVVVDRYWHSSAAYAIATEVNEQDKTSLPPYGDSIYEWPKDLLKPSLCVLLVVNPEERKRRIENRGEKLTNEEVEIGKNNTFQELLLESYKRMRGPGLEIVDANGTPGEVLEKVKSLIKKKLPSAYHPSL